MSSGFVLEMWRGVLLDQRTARFMDALASIVGPWLQPTQGSFRQTTQYSADTHAGAGAVDLSVIGMTRAQELEVITQARRMGAAAWIRHAIPGLWPRHIHLILIPPSGAKRNDGGLSSGAWGQVIDYYEGRNGLAGGGLDDGPRPERIITYEQWRAIAAEQAVKELEMALNDTDLARIAGIRLNRSGRTFATVLNLIPGLPAAIAAAVWSAPVTRGVDAKGRPIKISALQELADTKTGVLALRKEIAAIKTILEGTQSEDQHP